MNERPLRNETVSPVGKRGWLRMSGPRPGLGEEAGRAEGRWARRVAELLVIEALAIAAGVATILSALPG